MSSSTTTYDKYKPTFYQPVKGNYVDETHFVSLNVGSDAIITEREFNELQWVQTENLAKIVREIAHSGIVTTSDNDNNKCFDIVNNDENHLNGFELPKFKSIMNGFLTTHALYKNKIDGNIPVRLPNPPVGDVSLADKSKFTRHDFVYLEFWFSELKDNDSIPKYGFNVNDTLDYDIIDNRILKPTTHKIQLQWSICTYEDYENKCSKGFLDGDGNPNKNIHPQAQNGYTSKDYYFEQSPNDKNLFIAGEGLVSNMKIHTVDGYSYAIPLFNIIRLNNSGYDKLNNPNGAIDYVDKDSISDRPDGKFSNIIYSDQIYDLRHLSALGETQFDKIYTKLSKYIDDNVILKNKIIRLTSDIQHTNHILKNLGYTLPGIHDKDLYGIEMYHQYCQTSGGVLDNATMQVIYKKHKCYLSDALVSKNYGVIPTLIDYNYDEIGELGDLYIQKNTSYFNVYNTGAKNLTLDVTAVEVDNSIIYSGEGTFNGMDGTFITLGFNVDTEKHFIYICPLENSNGRNGEIFIKAIDNQFIVYNTGITTDKSGNLANTTGNKFQWILIDLQSTNMKNINAYNINLNGQKGYTLTHNSFGENYRLLVSTPIFTTADTIEEGSIGDIYADTEEDNQCIIYNTGKTGINVNCLIFNDVKYDEYYDTLSFVSQNSIPTIVQY